MTIFYSKCGLLARPDERLGLLVYSPYSGLIYAVHPNDSKAVHRWLKNGGEAPSRVYRNTIGAGWVTPLDTAEHVTPHLLPDKSAWLSLDTPLHPITINWFITGRCPLACKYCYAEDLMRNDDLEPSRDEIAQIGKQILRHKPLVVVITGGDPLFTSRLPDALRALDGKAGLILDTSGYTLNEKHIELLKKHNVAVRISLDSERPQVNSFQRGISILYPKLQESGISSLDAATRALIMCLDAGLSVTVQTVATKKNANDLLSLGDKLYRIGVKSWRIFRVSPSRSSMKGYQLLSGEFTDSGVKLHGKKAKGPYDYVFSKIRESAINAWNNKIAVQVTHNETRNSVVLVGPDGTFYTESNVSIGKVILDEQSPKSPSENAIQSKVNLLAHAERYLNLTRSTEI